MLRDMETAKKRRMRCWGGESIGRKTSFTVAIAAAALPTPTRLVVRRR